MTITQRAEPNAICFDILDSAQRNIEKNSFDDAARDLDYYKSECYDLAPVFANVQYLNLRATLDFERGNHTESWEHLAEASALLDKATKNNKLPEKNICYYRIETLSHIGDWYRLLGEYAKALKSYDEALAQSEYYRTLSNGEYHPRWVPVMINYVHVLWEMPKNERPEGVDIGVLLDKVYDIALFQDLEQRDLHLKDLCLMRASYMIEEDAVRSIKLLEEIEASDNSPNRMIRIWCGLALCYIHLKMSKKAFEYLEKAFCNFPCCHDMEGNPSLFILLMETLCRYYSTIGNMQDNTYKLLLCAVFYGKCAINAIEHLREKNTSLNKASQAAFLYKEGQIYDHVIQRLWSFGRYQEAQEISIHKRQYELFDYMLRDESRKGYIKITFTDKERERYEALRGLFNAIKLGKRSHQELKTFMTELPNYLELDTELQKDDPEFIKNFLTRIGNTSCLIRVISMENKDMENKDILILSRHNQKPVYEDISRHNLKKRAVDFYNLIQKNCILSTFLECLAEDLYNIIFTPIEKIITEEEFESMKKLYFALDGPMRCLPLLALRNKSKWLIEKHIPITVPLSVLTKGEVQYKKGNSTSSFGITDLGYGQALDEIAISHQEFLAGLPDNQVFFDADFTSQTLLGELKKQQEMVYVLSHFELGGNINDSKLMLGTKNPNNNAHDKLSLHDLAKNFSQSSTAASVRHISFAACQTGLMHGLGATSKEIECMGAFMLHYGVSGVIGTLWEVNAAATIRLMEFFHDAYSNNGVLELGDDCFEIMQEAIKTFLRSTNIPPPWKQPYYWAGYVMMTR
ncbi:hypothetical protein AGMMS50276_25290 [Synergistales bacterium]|nr:hypothetical protein AGMMS50276_25290 [Synergistales bacterium]